MQMRKNRCANCNAPLAAGTSFCHYCEPDRLGESRSASEKEAPRRFSGRTLLKSALGLVSLMCCAPLGVFGTLHETRYAIRMDAPKYSARPPPVAQRPAEDIAAMQVFMDMRDAGDRSLAQRKQEWREKYEGHWVSWKGRVEEVHANEGIASQLVLRPEEGQTLKVQVNFDPLYNAQLEQLREGQGVHVSGRLWGYYFLGDTVRLSEGMLLEPAAPRQVQTSPL
ncbi:hypothetical protein MEBOL_005862 [Melittangium boletus DSM 14713]|uniref:Uncharacterized protein n=2 Tax=Melittangium boletus TaxID=83453 RepID=A0A250IKU8_9BACT|nr:hypothetical protein MEBOL_005862 [Melittangium boletus DSM 14713]